jgi:hypothetical protein
MRGFALHGIDPASFRGVGDDSLMASEKAIIVGAHQHVGRAVTLVRPIAGHSGGEPSAWVVQLGSGLQFVVDVIHLVRDRRLST